MKTLRTVIAFAALWVVIVLGFSCRAAVTGDPRDAITDLCDLLKSCYGDDAVDCKEMRAQFGVDKGVDAGFLSFMASESCLDSCALAKACWDHAPICRGETATCLTAEQCCGFTTGLGSCADGNCCIPDGAPCDGRESLCCGGLPCRPRDDGGPPTCGGKAACAQIDQACDKNADCCSKICSANKVCVPKTCSNPGEGCNGDDECCPVDAPNEVACTLGTCQVTQCTFDSCGGTPTPCSISSTTQEGQCCGDPAAICIPDTTGGVAICSHLGDPLPNGFLCTLNDNCCSGYCDAIFLQCADAPSCTGWGRECSNSGTQCCDEVENGGMDLQSGECQLSTCVCAGAVTSCHSPFETGLAMACSEADAAADFQCIAQVCSTDNYCCCTQWDDLCVNEATSSCIEVMPQ